MSWIDAAVSGFLGGAVAQFLHGVPANGLPFGEDALRLPGAEKTDLLMGQFQNSYFVGCPHNDRGEITSTDIAEHIGNAEFGSAARDFVELPEVQAAVEVASEVAVDVLDAIGNEALAHNDSP